jgi:hypothetical protein
MIVTAWNNGDHHSDGNGYGIKLDLVDRNAFFKSEWKTILIELEGESNTAEVNIDKASFWNQTCRELISVEIGKWLIKNHLAPWKKGYPPQLKLEKKTSNLFQLTTIK